LQHDHTSVEVYGTVFALAESPHVRGELWAGSDDGMIWTSPDDGATWRDVTPQDLPVDGTVNAIDVSPHRPGKVTVAVQRYRMDDWAPYVFQTADGGGSWSRLTDGSNGIPADAPVRSVREDPDREGLLYAGTERGLFVSFDDGVSWQSMQRNLPLTPVTELLVHEQDLLVATQGRGLWILDDLTPLHQLRDDLERQPVWLMAPRPAIRAAGNGTRAATIRYRVPPDAGASLEILDPRGVPVRFWDSKEQGPRSLPAAAGVNVLRWDLRYPSPVLTDDALIYLGYSGGPLAVPGSYTVRLTAAWRVLTQPLDLLGDPRRDDVTDADWAANFELSMTLSELLGRSHAAIRMLRDVRDQARSLKARAAGAGIADEGIAEQADAIDATLTGIEQQLIQTRAEARQEPINFPPMLDTQIGYLYRYVVNTYGRPGDPAYARLAELQPQLEDLEAQLQVVVSQQVPGLNRRAAAAGVRPVMLRVRSSH